MQKEQGNILVVDDEPNIRKLLAGVLEDEGYRVWTAIDTAAAQAVLKTNPVDLMLLDVQLPDQDGLTYLRQLQGMADVPPVIMMSGHGTIATALEATRLGALDFIEKPIQAGRLLVSVTNGLRLCRLDAENMDLRSALDLSRELIGSSPAMNDLRRQIAQAAPTEARVLITGENGTGKELIARALHASSRRSTRPFIKINCAAIPSELLESELFGHERGAFTGAASRRLGKFERAQGGTLLLDEIGDMNPTTQAKLLRVLEEGELERVGGSATVKLDVRVFASTNRELDQLRADGSFREDLYHRLMVVPLRAPALREHRDDIETLAEHYLGRFCARDGCSPKVLTGDALAVLRAHSWPGNVRELKNLMERLAVMISAPSITAEALRNLLPVAGQGPDRTLAAQLLHQETMLITEALDRTGGNLAAAARELGLDRANLHRRLKKLGLKGED